MTMSNLFHHLVSEGLLPGLGLAELRVLIAKEASPGEISARKLAEATGLHRSTVFRALQRLKSFHIVSTIFPQGVAPTRQVSRPRDRGVAPTRLNPPGPRPVSVLVVKKEREQQQTGDPVLGLGARALGLGLGESLVATLLNKYGPERLSEGLGVVETARNPRNPSGLLRRALERGWKAPEKGAAPRRKKALPMISASCSICGHTQSYGAGWGEVEGKVKGATCPAYSGEPGRPGDLFEQCAGQMLVDPR